MHIFWLYIDAYDGVVMAGAMIPGHLDESCFSEVMRVVRPGNNAMMVTSMILLWYFLNF